MQELYSVNSSTDYVYTCGEKPAIMHSCQFGYVQVNIHVYIYRCTNRIMSGMYFTIFMGWFVIYAEVVQGQCIHTHWLLQSL